MLGFRIRTIRNRHAELACSLLRVRAKKNDGAKGGKHRRSLVRAFSGRRGKPVAGLDLSVRVRCDDTREESIAALDG